MGGAGVEVDVTVVVVCHTPPGTVTVIVWLPGSTAVLVTMTVTTDVEVEGTGVLWVTVTISVEMAGSAVMVEAPAMQPQADEYSSRLGQLEAIGYEADVEEGVAVGMGVDGAAVDDGRGLQPRLLWLLRFMVGSMPWVGAVTTSVTVTVLVAEYWVNISMTSSVSVVVVYAVNSVVLMVTMMSVYGTVSVMVDRTTSPVGVLLAHGQSANLLSF